MKKSRKSKKKVKKFISDHNLEEKIVNYLLKRASVKRPNLRDFSFSSILKYLNDKNLDVDEKKLEEILEKLKKEGILEKKYKVYEVYIPAKYKEKFSDLKTLTEPFIRIVSAFIVGYFVLYFLGIYGYVKEVVIHFPSGISQLMIYGFVLPLIFGIPSFVILENIAEQLVKRISFFKEMIEFLGGSKLFKYALFFAIVVGGIYLVIAEWLKKEIEPYFLIGLPLTAFLGILSISIWKKKK